MATLTDEITLSHLLREALGQGRELVSSRFLREATNYAVLAVTLAHPCQEVVLKLAGPQAVLAPDFERSAAIVQLVRSRSAVQTFEVLAVDTSANRWPWHYLITTWCSGQVWSEMSYAKKRNQRLATCGEIAPDGKVLAGTSYATALARRARQRIANPAHADLFLAVLQDHHALFSTLTSGGVLCHEDLNPGNLLV